MDQKLKFELSISLRYMPSMWLDYNNGMKNDMLYGKAFTFTMLVSDFIFMFKSIYYG